MSGLQCGADFVCRAVDEDADKGHSRVFFAQNGCDFGAGFGRDVARAFGVEVKAQQICAGFDGGEGVGEGFDAADFDFGHKFFP